MNTPAWNIETEYPSLTSPEFLADQKQAETLIEKMSQEIEALRPLMAQLMAQASSTDLIQSLQKILLMNQEQETLLRNLGVYVNCLESVDAKDEAAKAKASQLQILRSKVAQVFQPVYLFLCSCPEAVLNSVLEQDKLRSAKFFWQQERLQKDLQLSEKEENLLTALSSSGHSAWGEMYSAISGTMRVPVTIDGKTEEMGLAKAAALTRSAKEADRKAAYLGIHDAWSVHQESAASILNSLAGWRLELCKKRSHTRKVDFLTSPLFQNRIQAETLEAMMMAVQNNKQDIQDAARTMAQLHGKKKLDPWDLLAPAPLPEQNGSTDFETGLRQIRTAFGNAHPEFGDFVDTMARNGWIEGRVLPNKSNGAYCTGFPKSKTPRVFQTYLGSNMDITTLAHELGHAYHSWVMRDLSLEESDYPMTLAETASIFGETVLMDEMIATAKTREQKMDFAWANVEGAVSLLLNIPARFEFEKNFYTQRQERALSARELCELTDQAWSKWYGDTLTENDRWFWASKLHFSIAGTSFYNFPYTFGYLFALSIYARRKDLGAKFWTLYTEILRDTGRMTAEDLIQKHLGEDIRSPEFWQKSINVVKEKITDFKSLL
jgi:oligoendopeptidase F